MTGLPRPISVEAYYLAAVLETLHRLVAAVEQIEARQQEADAKALAADKSAAKAAAKTPTATGGKKAAKKRG